MAQIGAHGSGPEKFTWPASVTVFRDKLFVLDTGSGEVEMYLLSYPFLADLDSDSDGLTDDVEISRGTDRNDSDTDDDGMPDGWEVTYWLNPIVDDAQEDKDGDGWSNLKEYQRGTEPDNADSYPPKTMPWILLLLLDD